MTSLQSIPILGFPVGGLQTDSKPFLILETAFQVMNNAYLFRKRIRKRECNSLIGRLRRVSTGLTALGNTVAGSSMTFTDVLTSLGFTEPNAEIQPGSVVITITGADASSFTDLGNGTFSVTGKGVAAGSYINYATGLVVLQFSPNLSGGNPITININYYPALPVMTIAQRDLSGFNNFQSVVFDQKYAYIFSGNAFQEFEPGFSWNGTDFDFFWVANYRGVTPDLRLFFATNFNNNAANPMAYSNGSNWTTFQPQLDGVQNYLQSALILIPYFGRLIALNTWEGSSNYASSSNIFNRARYSAIGDPTAANAWRSDIIGQGGFIDAPTNEAITSAAFIKNTLLVTFEKSTWQLRYVGEYGVPFIWERVSSDYGSESPYATIIFNEGVLSPGDKAYLSIDSVNVRRIDEQIPDQIFQILVANNGNERVGGVRDYQRELVFWNYPNAETLFIDGASNQYFPNNVLVYNYRNNAYSVFRDNVTAFGSFQTLTGITWDSVTVTWDDDDVTWDSIQQEAQFPLVVAGNQEGFVFKYGYSSKDDGLLSITGINLTTTPIQLTIVNHNLTTGEFITLFGLQFIDGSTFLPVTTSLLTNPYTNPLQTAVYQVTFIDLNTVSIEIYDFTTNAYVNNFPFTPATTAIYVGGGTAALLPVLDVVTKDFNPYQTQGRQTMLSYVDFLTDSSDESEMTVNIQVNASQVIRGNLLVGNKEVETYLPSPFYNNTANSPVSDYAWHRFYATVVGQYFNVEMTYDDILMNTYSTHTETWVLEAINMWAKPAGKIMF